MRKTMQTYNQKRVPEEGRLSKVQLRYRRNKIFIANSLLETSLYWRKSLVY